MNWLRSILAVILGMLLCFSIVALVEAAGSRLVPPSEDVKAIMEPLSKLPPNEVMAALRAEMAKPEVRATFLAQPFTVFLPPLFSWIVAGMMGSWAAGLIARRRPMVHGFIVGGLFLLATIMNLFSLPHPVWMQVASLVLVPGAIFFGASLADVRLNPQPAQVEV